MQLAELREQCARRGWQIVGEYIDAGVSGAKDRRPELDRLMQDAHKRKFDIVTVWKFDRFARSVSHLLRALDTFRVLGVEFVSLSESLDTATPAGRMVFTVLGAVAELERSLIAERVRAGLRNARAKGTKLGRPAARLDHARIALLRAEGRSLREIATDIGCSPALVHKSLADSPSNGDEKEFYQTEKTAARAQSIQDALGVINGKACFDGCEEPVFLRVAEHDSSLWLDLGNRTWQALQITIYGWRVIDKPPIRFRRSPGMLALPVPIRGGKVGELDAYLNLQSEGDGVLVYSWLMAAFRPRGPYPILHLLAEQGTAKSTASRVLRALVDPFTAPLRSAPRDERDLQIAARNSHIIALDNMSNLAPWLSDALCRIVTGGGLATRELYSDSDEIIFDAQRPVLLNGIEDVASRGDFIERSVMVYLAQIKEAQRQEEARFWSAFEDARPRILGGLLDALVAGLNNIDGVHLSRLPRMADFARWAASTEEGLGFRAGTFMDAYDRNRKDASDLALDSSPVVAPIVALIEAEETWKGTVSELLLEIAQRSCPEIAKTRGWPKSPQSFSGILRRLAPNLRTNGISVSFPSREAGTGRRLVIVERAPITSSQPSHRQLPRCDFRDDCDGHLLANSAVSV
jgi:DNA invertase Pin-like site-specific DNA recombinase